MKNATAILAGTLVAACGGGGEGDRPSASIADIQASIATANAVPDAQAADDRKHAMPRILNDGSEQ